MTSSLSRILVVDDEPEIRRFLRASLRAQQYEVLEAGSGTQALEVVAKQLPDLMILDLGLPDIDGVEVTRRIRQWSQIPIIILSVRDREKDKIEALDAGADDYLTKPFGVGELAARMRVVMRRVSPETLDLVYEIKGLKMDLARRLVTLAPEGKDITLTPTEFDLLLALIRSAGRVITHRQLIRQVWGSGYEQDPSVLRVNISNLRHKIEPDLNQPYYILTELGVGYRFREP